jgi:hypothetical protein
MGQEEAFELVLDQSWKMTGVAPPLWERALPSDRELGVVSKSFEGQMLLDLFHGLV